MEQVEELLQGSRRALARLISLVENNDPRKEEIMRQLFPYTGKAYLIGITGAPGAGKSSLVDRLLTGMRRSGFTVGVIAVDPTSPFTGGAILGDRIRMQEHALDSGIFIRSMGTRGSLGGISRAAREAVQVMDAFGKDIIIIETVGVGQSEIDIVKAADSTVVVLTPAGGDSVQTIKAGIMEIGDIFVVNKCDLPGAERTVAEVKLMLDLKEEPGWRPPVIPVMALRGEGVDELCNSLREHRDYLQRQGLLEARRRERAGRELGELVEFLVKSRVWDSIKTQISLDQFIEAIALRRRDPYSAARELLRQINFPH
ncbi:MAG TPA: methylmalonyl Co-A mutase-associated GTPase MeaB [Bacillota bacterium]|jgi:LAO/AO transport system kinase|nr:methylmalonyl Co-A mutase-associated GTPase MeaB [Bacillota bacterium]HOA36361.1 methylmalonyl Co-A mutase-associated GTPase MeaB [Bacillota bacterium]HOJ84825.1 methylmalonyl Co-A mutase-associated GTPase MeaB [Bacillota bacterium]HOL14813.1 methylmalonyl Co-A mutase-associated GTPase MeaB [Bacillota bacterium]HPZ12344.1 methylmalonyl Co-A mutase-associated GTPase MeaB [Bacillota bacterium]